MAMFLGGVVFGSVGVGAIHIAAGDPYEYATLHDYPCSLIRSGDHPPPKTMVPGQSDPCFVRYWRWWIDY